MARAGTVVGFGPCSGSGVHAATLAPGSYGFEARAIDPVGNADPTPAHRGFIVQPAPAAVRRIAAVVRTFWTVQGAVTRVRTLLVRGMPRGGTVNVRCRGTRCPYRRRAFTPRRGRVNLQRAFGKRRLRAGTVIEIRLTAPGRIGKVVRYKLRRGRFPSRSTRCLPPGSRKATRCR